MCARCAVLVGVEDGVVEERVNLTRDNLSVEAQAQLGLGELQLAHLGDGDGRSGLEELGRDAELLRQHPQCLDRRTPGPGLDARDVGIGDPRCREVALREALLAAQALQALSDGLTAGFGVLGHDRRNDATRLGRTREELTRPL